MITSQNINLNTNNNNSNDNNSLNPEIQLQVNSSGVVLLDANTKDLQTVDVNQFSKLANVEHFQTHQSHSHSESVPAIDTSNLNSNHSNQNFNSVKPEAKEQKNASENERQQIDGGIIKIASSSGGSQNLQDQENNKNLNVEMLKVS